MEGGCENFSKELPKLKEILKSLTTPEGPIIKINYHSYNFNWNFQLFMDMIYRMNKVKLGINEVLQLIELTYGEGE